MSSTSLKPLSDDEASKEMKKMVAFIMQEAAEKCREIQVKADEEFNIEKAKFVNQETATIEQQYARKLKQAEVKRRIAQSVQINKARLQVLQARDQVLDDVFDETKKLLRSVPSNEGTYQQLLDSLVLQCLFRLSDERVSLTCRVQDVVLVEKAISSATKEYTKQTGIRPTVTLESSYLPADCAGGIMGSSHNNRIRCDNTLEARLEQTFELMLPELRVRLFGHSPGRKFFD